MEKALAFFSTPGAEPFANTPISHRRVRRAPSRICQPPTRLLRRVPAGPNLTQQSLSTNLFLLIEGEVSFPNIFPLKNTPGGLFTASPPVLASVPTLRLQFHLDLV